MESKHPTNKAAFWLLRIVQGALIGVGAVLPGISGGILCVVFGIYKPVMELLSNPIRRFRTHVPPLLPVLIGVAVGFLGIAKLLAFFLETYPEASVCAFAGMIIGMLPDLFKEAGQKRRSKGSWISLCIAGAFLLALLIGLRAFEVQIVPNIGWYLFCGVCLALSIIVPGMSFSTLLMPMGLYTPFVAALGGFDFGVIAVAGVGALITIALLSKAVNHLFERYYSFAFHAIIGIVIASTLMILPYQSFVSSPVTCVINIVCLVCGVLFAWALGRFNSRFSKEEEA